MAFEEFRLQLAMLMDEIARNPADAHELQETNPMLGWRGASR